MSEQLLKRRSEQPRVTHKMERVSPSTMEWPKRLLVLLGVAVGGALLGQLGSSLFTSVSSRGGGGSASVLTRAGSLPERQAEIDALLGNRDYGAALLLIDEALLRFPGDAGLAAQKRRVEEEIKNRFRYEMFERAATKHNYAAALALYDEIGLDSVYRARAAEALPPLRSRFLGELTSAAQAAAGIGQCGEARQIVARIQAVDVNHPGVRAILDSCANEATGGRRP